MKNRLFLSLLLLLAAWMCQPAAAEKISANLNTAFQMDLVTFVVPEGRVLVYLPGDIAPGDQISGNVIVIPKGSTVSEKKANLRRLMREKVVFENNNMWVKQGSFLWKIPAEGSSSSSPLILINSQNIEVTRLAIPLLEKPGTPDERMDIPTVGQAGRPLLIRGKFDGDFSTTMVKIDQQSIPLIAESPRQALAYPPNGLLGSTDISIEKNGITASAEYRSVGVLFSAGKMTLYKGEKTKVKMLVKGLKGIEKPLQIDVTNLTPDIVTAKPVNFVVMPKSVSESGNVMVAMTLESIKTGTFNLSASVNVLKWDCPDGCAKEGIVDSRQSEMILIPLGAEQNTVGPYPVTEWPSKFLSEIHDRFPAEKPGFTVRVRAACRQCERATCKNGASKLEWNARQSDWINAFDLTTLDENGGLVNKTQELNLEEIKQKAEETVSEAKCP